MLVSIQSCALIGLLTCLALVQLVQANPVNDVFEKCEAYVNGKGKITDLSIIDIQQAAKAYRAWPEEMKKRAKAVPLVKLTIDFVVHPFEIASLQIENRQSHYNKFVERAVKAYALFRGPYAYGQIFNGFMAKAKKLTKIVEVASGEKPRSDLVLKDFEIAKMEYDGYLARLDEITAMEDIYGCIPEMKKIYSYLNDPFLRSLVSGVFPFVNKKATVDDLLKRFYKQLDEGENIYLNGGRWTKRSKNNQIGIAKVAVDNTPLRETELGSDEQVRVPVAEENVDLDSV